MSVVVRVQLGDAGPITSMTISMNDRVVDVCDLIHQMAGNNVTTDQTEYGLRLRTQLHPSQPSHEEWLRMDAIMGAYPVRAGSFLHYRKLMRPLRIRLSEGDAQKTIMVDDTQLLGEVLRNLCKKIGITNYEEYSLVFDEFVDIHTGLRRKLQPDEQRWLDLGLGLREQSIGEECVLILRKKYFYSDQEINKDDPVQISVLFGQAKDQILSGVHPVTHDEAAQFGGMQLQIEFGEHNPDRHKTGFIKDLRAYVPEDFVKSKAMERALLAEWAQHAGCNELTIKYKYIQKCRSLQTYGMTFFRVKEKIAGKNKSVDRLFGVTRESVLRLDDRTKEVLKTWPLTVVKRWAHTPTTFTLDFGDYAGSFYCAYTDEGPAISSLIAGYIDIILKRRKADEEKKKRMVPEKIIQLTETIVQPEPQQAMLRPGSVSTMQITTAQLGQAGVASVRGDGQARQAGPTISDLPKPQRALVCESSVVKEAILNELNQFGRTFQGWQASMKDRKPPMAIGNDQAAQDWRQEQLDIAKYGLCAQVAGVGAATAALMSLVMPSPIETKELDFSSLGMQTVALMVFSGAAVRTSRFLVSLDEPATTTLVESLSDAVCGNSARYLQIISEAVGRTPDAKVIMASAIQALTPITATIAPLLLATGTRVPDATQAAIMDVFKRVAAGTTAILPVIEKCAKSGAQAKLMGLAKALALTTSELAMKAKMLISLLGFTICQSELVNTARVVAGLIEDMVAVAQNTCKDRASLNALSAGAAQASTDLSTLIDKVQEITGQTDDSSPQALACRAVLDGTQTMRGSLGNSKQIVEKTTQLADAAATLVEYLAQTAPKLETKEAQQAQLQTSRALANAMEVVVTAAKRSAREPKNVDKQNILITGCESLHVCTISALSDLLRRQASINLVSACHSSLGAAFQLFASSEGVQAFNTSREGQQQLLKQILATREVIGKVLQQLQAGAAAGQTNSALSFLITDAKAFLASFQKLVGSAKSAMSTVEKSSSKQQLGATCKTASSALTDLRNAILKALEACGPMELAAAFELVKKLERKVVETEGSARERKLQPLPNETPESSLANLNAAVKGVQTAVTQVSAAAGQGNSEYAGSAAQDLASNLKALVVAVRGVAATTEGSDTQILTATLELLKRNGAYLLTVKDVVSGNDSMEKSLAAARSVAEALDRLLEHLPGQRDIAQAITKVDRTRETLANPGAAVAGADQRTRQQKEADIMALANSLRELSASIANPNNQGDALKIAESAVSLSDTHARLVREGLSIAGEMTEVQGREDVVSFLNNVSAASSRLLKTGKSMALNPLEAATKSQLSAAVRDVSAAINLLLKTCVKGIPGETVCESAIRSVQATLPRLEDSSSACDESTFFDCLVTVSREDQTIDALVQPIGQSAQTQQMDEFARAIEASAVAVQAIIMATSQAAYLVALASPSSQTGEVGAIDPAQLLWAEQQLTSIKDRLSGGVSGPALKELQAATSKYSNQLITACRTASEAVSNGVLRQQFTTFGDALAVGSAQLLSALATARNAAAALDSLLKTARELREFCDGAEFASRPAMLGDSARAAQDPYKSTGRHVVAAAVNMYKAAKSLAGDPRHATHAPLFFSEAGSLQMAVKSLVAVVCENAPGQLECNMAERRLMVILSELDEAAMASGLSSLKASGEAGLATFQDQVQELCTNMRDTFHMIVSAARNDPQRLAKAAQQITNQAGALSASLIGLASKLSEQKQQGSVLQVSRTVFESALQLVQAARDAGGNPAAHHLHPALSQAFDNGATALADISSLVSSVGGSGAVAGYIQAIYGALDRLGDPMNTGSSFAECHNNMGRLVKVMAAQGQTVAEVASRDVEGLLPQAGELTNSFLSIATDARQILSLRQGLELSALLTNAMRELGDSLVDVVQAAANVQRQGKADQGALLELQQMTRALGKNATAVHTLLKAGSRGTQACIAAQSVVESAILDLETTAMFASSGSLAAESETDDFAVLCQQAERDVGLLDDAVLAMGEAVFASQDQLAAATEAFSQAYTVLIDKMKRTAAALGPSESTSQMTVLLAAKNLSACLADFLDLAKQAGQDTPKEAVNSKQQAVAAAAAAARRALLAMGDEASRSQQALSGAIDSIEQELASLFGGGSVRKGKGLNNFANSWRDGLALNTMADAQSVVPTEETIKTPEDLIMATRPLTNATSKIVSALSTGKTSDLAAAANQSCKAVEDLLRTCRMTAAGSAESSNEMQSALAAARQCGLAMQGLLNFALLTPKMNSVEDKKKLLEKAREVAAAVSGLTRAAEAMKAPEAPDPNDPNVIAEQELNAAAAAIEAATNRLAAMNEEKAAKSGPKTEMSFHDLIVDAAKSLSAASGVLVKAAVAAQREHGSVGALATDQDNEWSSSLVNAAKVVAVATTSLCEAAGALVSGNGSTERMVAAAKQVSTGTAKLLIACKLHKEAESPSMKRLQNAGNAVKHASEKLVATAMEYGGQTEDSAVNISEKLVRGMAQELEAAEAIARQERELETAKRALQKIRASKFKRTAATMVAANAFLAGKKKPTS